MTVAAREATDWLALDAIAMSRAPNRQIRDVRTDDVAALLETDPTTWDPITVRPWPADESYPPGEEDRPYQLIAGYHRLTAARQMVPPQGIKAQVRTDITDDKSFLLVALTSNLRHGTRMQRADVVAQMRVLRDEFGMSLGDIAKSLTLPKGTVQSWLAGRDTNAARLARDASGEQRQASGAVKSLAALPPAWRVAPTPDLSAREIQRIEDAITDALAADPSATLKPADLLAWAAQLQPARQQMLLKGLTQLATFWAQVSRTLGTPKGE